MTSVREPAPRHARPFVALFLVVLVTCAAGAWNAWPFSSWELFSRLRSNHENAWVAVATDRSGRQQRYRLESRPSACASILRGAAIRLGPGTSRVRVYHLAWLRTDRRGSRAAPPHRTREWSCAT